MSFKSKLAPYIEEMITEKQSMGFSCENLKSQLQKFDNFLVDNNLDTGLLDDNVIEEWEKRLPAEADSTRNGRLKTVDNLAEYMHELGLPASMSTTYGKVVHLVPYVPSADEISQFLQCVDSCSVKAHGLHARVAFEYSIMFRLYFLCGMRLSEVVSLKRDNVDLKKGSIYIRHSKGDKDRYVYTSEDLRLLLNRYDRKMEACIPDREYFFPGKETGKPFAPRTLESQFRKIWDKCFPRWTGKRPTVHSLRHAFVVERINGWAKEGKDFKVMVPALSKYLGHSSINETYYYYHMLNPREGTIRTLMGDCSISGEIEL